VVHKLHLTSVKSFIFGSKGQGGRLSTKIFRVFVLVFICAQGHALAKPGFFSWFFGASKDFDKRDNHRSADSDSSSRNNPVRPRSDSGVITAKKLFSVLNDGTSADGRIELLGDCELRKGKTVIKREPMKLTVVKSGALGWMLTKPGDEKPSVQAVLANNADNPDGIKAPPEGRWLSTATTADEGGVKQVFKTWMREMSKSEGGLYFDYFDKRDDVIHHCTFNKAKNVSGTVSINEFIKSLPKVLNAAARKMKFDEGGAPLSAELEKIFKAYKVSEKNATVYLNCRELSGSGESIYTVSLMKDAGNKYSATGYKGVTATNESGTAQNVSMKARGSDVFFRLGEKKYCVPTKAP
jgi:hypothetical protein